jgi:hypothetical protein
MGPTALLPFRKEGVLRFFSFAQKNPTASCRILTRELGVLKASTIPLRPPKPLFIYLASGLFFHRLNLTVRYCLYCQEFHMVTLFSPTCILFMLLFIRYILLHLFCTFSFIACNLFVFLLFLCFLFIFS